MVRAALLAALLLGACGGGGSGAGSPPPPPPPPPGPTTTNISAAEGENERVEIDVSRHVTMGPGNSYVLPLSGADRALFNVSSGGGSITPITAHLTLGNGTGLDFEYPRDANGDNIYEVTAGSENYRVIVTNVVDTARVTREAIGFVDPVAYATLSINDTPSGTLGLVAERDGRIRRIDNGGAITYPGVYLDLRGQVSTDPGAGLMNLLFTSDGSGSRLYVLLCNVMSDLELREYQLEFADTRNIVPGTERLILRVDMPAGAVNRGGLLTTNSNGSRIIVGIGDGGSPGAPSAQAQNTFSPLGKILRILTNGDDFPTDPDRNFHIPPENPMANGAAGLPEVWGLGVRDPRGGAFDVRSNDVYVTDLGETMDEVNRLLIISPGSVPLTNFGWPLREGTNAYNGGADDPSFVRPIAQRPHMSGSTMTGGFAYYGRTELYQSEYFFGDPVAGGLHTFVPRLAIVAGQASQTFINRTLDLVPDAGAISQPVAIVQDANRDLFILDGDGELFKYHASWY